MLGSGGGFPFFAVCVACLLLLALLLGVIGIAIPDWIVGDVTTASGVTVERKVGLWNMCGVVNQQNVASTSCDTIGSFIDAGNCNALEDAFTWMRVLAIIGLVGLLLSSCIIIVGALIYNIFVMGCAVCLLLVALGLLIAVIIGYPVQIQQEEYTNCFIPGNILLANGKLCPGCDLSAGWILLLIAIILAFIALCAMYCVCFTRRRRRFLPPPIMSPTVAPPPPPMPVSPVVAYTACNPCYTPCANPCAFPSFAGAVDDPLLYRNGPIQVAQVGPHPYGPPGMGFPAYVPPPF